MPVSDMLRLQTANLTSQQIADMALEADREARRLRRGGDLDAARLAEQERDQLAEMFQRSK